MFEPYHLNSITMICNMFIPAPMSQSQADANCKLKQQSVDNFFFLPMYISFKKTNVLLHWWEMSEILSSCWWCCCWRLGGCCRSVMGAAGCPHLRCWRCSSSSALGCSVSGRGCGEQHRESAPTCPVEQHRESAPTHPVETMRTAHRISTNTPCGNNVIISIVNWLGKKL